MDLENTYHKCEVDTECLINMINSLSLNLDYFTSENIEEEMVCSFDCCMGYSIEQDIRILIESNATQSIIGEIGLAFLSQLEEDFDWVTDCYEKGFSKTPRWLAFVDYARKANAHLKRSLKELR